MAPAPPRCPFCHSADVELVSTFGGQIITSQFRCLSCSTYFEAVREDFEAVSEDFEAVSEDFEATSRSEPHG